VRTACSKPNFRAGVIDLQRHPGDEITVTTCFEHTHLQWRREGRGEGVIARSSPIILLPKCANMLLV